MWNLSQKKTSVASTLEMTHNNTREIGSPHCAARTYLFQLSVSKTSA
jgi:hypothetical protein